MSWFDLAALGVVALALVDGARGGLVWAALVAVFVAAAALAARTAAPHVEPYVRKVADLSPDDVRGAAHSTVLALAALAAAGVLYLLKPATRRRRFNRDGIWGAALGLATGLVAVVVVFAVLLWPSRRTSAEDALAESRLVALTRAANEHGLARLLPDWTAERLDELRGP